MNKSETKFQIGDHVVVIKHDDYPGLVGVTGVVLENSTIPYIRLDDKTRYPKKHQLERDMYAIRERDLELFHIHNSPLWRALS